MCNLMGQYKREEASLFRQRTVAHQLCMLTKEEEVPTMKQTKLPLYVSLGIVGAAVAGYFFIPAVREFAGNAWDVLTSDDEQRIRQWVGQFGWVGPLVIVLTMIMQMFLLVIPTPLVMVVSVLAYGPVWGSLIILAGIYAASTTGYGIGRYFGPSLVEKLLGHKTEQKISSFVDDYGFWAVVVTRLSPFLSNDAISFVGGMLCMRYWRFIGATVLGITPLTLFIAYLGEDNHRLKTGLLWTSVVSIVLFAAYVWWDRRRRK